MAACVTALSGTRREADCASPRSADSTVGRSNRRTAIPQHQASNETMSRLWSHHPRIMLAAGIVLTAFGCLAPDFGSDTESTARTYKQHIAGGGDAWFDPVGASDIYQRCHSTRDGYDAWWRLDISQNNFDKLLAVVASAHHGPDPITQNKNTEYPSAWKPDESPPEWWNRNSGLNAKSVYWCHDAGAAERHHGWYFLYDPDKNRMWCWHWNHQWSSTECQ